MGTPAYMPPEQARGLWDEVDARSDLWAVGATMCELLSGRAVHEGRTANEVLLEAMTKEAAPLAVARPGSGPAVAHVVDRALAFDRSQRWESAAQMQEAVRRAFHDRDGAPITTASRLTVPANAPDRPLAIASDGRSGAHRPTTNGPVARDGAPVAPRLARRRVAVLATGGALALGLLVLAGSLRTQGARRASAGPAAAVASVEVPASSA